MASPALSRSPSASFAPGSHRRSHPNLHHLSLAPLTPKYPINPADYNAYFDPVTSELHTSASISHIASLPSPGGILSNSPARSRATSRNRLKRKVKSSVAIQIPNDVPSGALTSEGFGYQRTESRRHLSPSDSSWLVQTGLALTEGSRESKGQSWIVKRDSSTSLHTPLEERPIFRSGRATPRSSSNRRRSRRDLAMTSAGVTPAQEYAAPDWADSQAQAENAAKAESEFMEQFDEDDENDYDPYGILDFEGHFESDDEEEVRAVISKSRLGRWMDGLVDVFLQLEEEMPEQPSVNTEAKRQRDFVTIAIPEGNSTDAETSSIISDGVVESPPQAPKGIWEDVSWFGRMVARTVAT